MHPNRQVIYEATIRRMVTEALNEKEERFTSEHSSDTDAQLVMYLRQCAAGLGYTPHAKEIIGWQYLLERFAYFQANKELWQNSVLILQDIFCGVVPMGAENRAWRQRAGRLAQYLSKEAERVSRIFCGLEQRLK